MIKIKANQDTLYMEAAPWDCIYLTYPGDRHTPVQHRMQGTITTRPGELGVYVPEGTQ